MRSKQTVNLKEYQNLIETIAKVEYKKLSSSHLIEYLELVNIATHTLYLLFQNKEPETYNNSYLATAIKWAIRNEVRRRYRWYSLRNKKVNDDQQDDLREVMYRTILSIDEMTDSECPAQIKDNVKTPEEFLVFGELKTEIVEAIKKLPQRERELIESKFFKDKKLREIAEEFKISPSRISRIIQSGLNHIKKELDKQEE